MEQMFLGNFEHALDDKGRITIPAKLRAKLAAGMFITTGIDPCLSLYPADRWMEEAQKINALPMANPRAREYRRQFFGSAADLEPDRQGRVGLPSYLREYAHIDRQVLIIGLGDHCEIWDPAMRREHEQRGPSDPEERARQYEDLGI